MHSSGPLYRRTHRFLSRTGHVHEPPYINIYISLSFFLSSRLSVSRRVLSSLVLVVVRSSHRSGRDFDTGAPLIGRNREDKSEACVPRFKGSIPPIPPRFSRNIHSARRKDLVDSSSYKRFRSQVTGGGEDRRRETSCTYTKEVEKISFDDCKKEMGELSRFFLCVVSIYV